MLSQFILLKHLQLIYLRPVDVTIISHLNHLNKQQFETWHLGKEIYSQKYHISSSFFLS